MKLLILAPCEKVIHDADSGHSLITVFHALNVFSPANGEPMPLDAVVPREWAIFSKYELSPDEELKPYTAYLELYWPNGNRFLEFSLESAQPTSDGMAFVMNLKGFPIGQSGNLRVVSWLQSGNEIVSEKQELNIRVHITKAPEVAAK